MPFLEVASFADMGPVGSTAIYTVDSVVNPMNACGHVVLMDYQAFGMPEVGSPLLVCCDCGTLFAVTTMAQVPSTAPLSTDDLWVQRQVYNALR